MTANFDPEPLRLAKIQMYLFSRAVRNTVKWAEAELEKHGIERDSRIPILDQLVRDIPDER